ALSDRSLGPDLPTVPVDDALDGSQSDSGAFKLFSQVQTLENAEEFIDILHIKAHAVIFDEHLSLVFPFIRAAKFDFGLCSYPGELDRIGNQVTEGHFHHGTVPVTDRKRPDFPGNFSALRLLPELRDDLPDKLLQVHRRHFGLGASDLRIAQEVVDQGAHSL